MRKLDSRTVVDALARLLEEKYRVRCERQKRFPWLRLGRKAIVAEAYFGPPLHCLFVFDSAEHLTPDRGRTIAAYPSDTPLSFHFRLHQELCAESRMRSTPRTRERAAQDAQLDLVPPKHGLNPTLRLAEAEIADRINGEVTERKLRVALEALLERTLSLHIGTTFQQLLDHPSGKPFVPRVGGL
jgi:hypothetical protein